MNNTCSTIEIIFFLVMPFLVIVLAWVRIKAQDKDLLEDTSWMDGLDTDGPYFEGRAIMEAAAVCEQRRHGRRRGDPIVVEWDQDLFPRESTDVGVHAAWLRSEGPKSHITVKLKRNNGR